MKRFVFSHTFTNKVAKNNDPLHSKNLYIKSFATGVVLLVLGVLFLFLLGPQFTVFSWVMIVSSIFVFADGIVTKNRK